MPNRFKKNGMHPSVSSPIGERVVITEPLMREPGDIHTVSAETRPGAAQAVMDFILDHPGIALGTALTLGVLVGWLLKRK